MFVVGPQDMHSLRDTQGPEQGRTASPPIVISLDAGSHTHSYDFLGKPDQTSNDFSCPLPFQFDEVYQTLRNDLSV